MSPRPSPELCAISAAAPTVPTAMETLVDGLLRGKPEAARDAWELFSDQVFRHLRRAFGVTIDVDDLAQEVFLRLFDAVKKLEKPEALPSFVTAITMRVVKKELTRRYRRRWLSFVATPEDTPAVHVDHDAREALVRLYALLDRFDPISRSAFILRHIEEMELAQIAAALETSLATVKRRLARIEVRLTALIEDDPTFAQYRASGRFQASRKEGSGDA